MPRLATESFKECPCSGRSLARLVHAAVLGALAKGEGHGYEVARRLGELPAFASQPADFAAIYRVLGALERDGYAQSRWEEPRSGPARKVFRLTAAGRSCLGQWRRTLRGYRRELDELLGFL